MKEQRLPPRWNNEIEHKLNVFPIHVQCGDSIRQTTWHRQPGLEMHLTHEGRAAFLSEGETILQEPKQLLIHNGSIPHRFLALAAPSYRRSVLCLLPFSSEHFLSYPVEEIGTLLPGEKRQYNLDVSAYRQLSDDFVAIEAEIREGRTGWQHMALSLLLKVIVSVHRLQEEPYDTARINGVSAMVRACMTYVHEHLDDDLSLAAMSQLFSISEEQLIRNFRKELGISFHQYVIAKKIDRSMRLLDTAPELSILEVALECGFSSASHFSRTFKRLTGATPSDFRQHSRH